MSDLLWGAFSGDMGALTVLWFLLLPFVAVVSAIGWLLDKVRGR